MFMLPPKVSRTLRTKGYNDSFEEAFHMKNTNPEAGGVLSIMSQGALSRPKQMQEAVDGALLSLLATKFYGEEP